MYLCLFMCSQYISASSTDSMCPCARVVCENDYDSINILLLQYMIL